MRVLLNALGNLWYRVETFWWMFSHLIQHPFHVEERHTYGPIVFGVHVGLRLDARFCRTCGYLKRNI